MPNERITTRGGGGDKDELFVQKIVENVLSNKNFIKSIVDSVASAVRVEIQNEIKVINEKVKSLEDKLMDRIDSLEQYSRINNLRIFGLPEIPDENANEAVIEFCREKLDVALTNNDIVFCHRLHGKNDQPRPILIKFVRRDVKWLVYSNKKKLKRSRIMIREDLTMLRLQLLKEATNKFGPNKVWTSNTRIFAECNKKTFKIEKLSDIVQPPL